MHDTLADFLRHLGLEKQSSAHTVKSYREDLTQAISFFRDQLRTDAVNPVQLTPRLLRSYLAWLHSRGYARTTVARRLAAVRSWMRFLCRQGVLERNPAEGLRGPRQDQRLPHFLTADQVQKLLAALSEEEDAIEEMYEPYLMQIGMIDRTPRGRVATPRAFEYFGRELPKRQPRLF